MDVETKALTQAVLKLARSTDALTKAVEKNTRIHKVSIRPIELDVPEYDYTEADVFPLHLDL